jgi:glycosyltransferase involved in cell wall biosynthesis
MLRTKKILIAASVFPPEPIVSANLLADLAESLSKEFEVVVLRPHPTRPKGFKMPSYSNENFPYKAIEIDTYTCPESSLIGRFKESIDMGKKYANYIQEHASEIDLIYNDAWHLFGYHSVARAAVKNKIPYIVTVQDIYPESLASKLPNSRLLRWMVMKALGPIDHYTLSHATKIHTISDKMVSTLQITRRLPKDQFIIARNWQDERPFLNCVSSGVGERPFTFMYCGNVGPLAGIEVIIDGFVQAEINNSRLVIAGAGSSRESLRTYASNFPGYHIEFWDVPSGKVPFVQSQSDVMVLSVKKGFAISSIPSKLPAYMFSGKPVLCSVDRESDTAKCILESQGGWVVEPENSGVLAKQMKEVASIDKKNLILLGERGRDYALTLFSRKNNLYVLTNACKEVLNKN